jgi:hypothetical protein
MRSTYITVDFPNTVLDRKLTIWSANITQNRYSHDIGKLVFRNWNIPKEIIIVGSPMNITLTDGETSRQFVGYVHSIRKTNTVGKKFTEVYFIGSSYRMKQKSKKIYKYYLIVFSIIFVINLFSN